MDNAAETIATETIVRFMIVDDHPVVLEGLRTMLSGIPGIQLVATCNSGKEALEVLGREEVDVLVADLRMEPMTGIELVRHVARLTNPPRTLVLSSYEKEEEIFQVMSAGASGYLTKYSTAKQMIEAIREISAGNLILPAHLQMLLEERRGRKSLSARETQVLEMMTKGLTNKEIAHVFGVSQFTVRNQIVSISRKLNVSDRTEATRVALEQGIISM